MRKLPGAKAIPLVIVFFLGCSLALPEEPDGLTLPPGFHASVVADGLGPVRHLAVRKNGDIYVSTESKGIIALHLDANHKADRVEHFSSVDGGTAIAFYKGALYATSPSDVYRFTFSDDSALVPLKEPEVIVEGMAAADSKPTNRALAFDGKGDLLVGLAGSGNICVEPNTPAGAPPVGVKPCPILANRAGIWRFHTNKAGQKFPADGERIATGIRDSSSLAWSPSDKSLYGIMHGRDNTHRTWPGTISAEDDDHIADEMDRVTPGTDFGWPYTYYDGARKMRLVSPEYGGDGKTLAAGNYATPVLTFTPRAAPVDLVFYSGGGFPAAYRKGAFVVLHGSRQLSGFDVVFVPFNRRGVAGPATVFADGFAAFDPSSKNPNAARYRPVGIAVGPGGALYVADSQKGRIWRIAYGADRSRPGSSTPSESAALR